MTTATLSRSTVGAHEGPSFVRLIGAELTEIRLYWLIPVGVTAANLLINALLLFFSEGANGEHDLASSIPTNWAFSWFILFLVVGIVRGLSSTPQAALSGAGLKMQNRVGWVSDGLEALGAILVWMLAMTLVPSSERSIFLADSQGNFLGLPLPFVFSGGLALLVLWASIGAIGRIVSHSFRIWSTWGGLFSLVVLLLLGPVLGAVASWFDTTMSAGSWESNFVLAMGGIGLLMVPIAWVLGERGPIRTVG